MNESLVRQVMAHIRANQDSWNQSDFVGWSPCGTTHCFAGWALRLSGFGLVGSVFQAPEGMELEPGLQVRGRIVATDFTAQWLLGFTDRQASAVFFAFQQTDVDVFAREVERVTGLSGL